MKAIVWGPTFEIADKELERVKQDYINYHIPVEKECKSNHQHSIVFENGDIWRALNFSESHKGQRANLSYIHHSLLEEFDTPHIRGMISNCTHAYPWQGFRLYG